jgi:UDP-glucose 4-epimerase
MTPMRILVTGSAGHLGEALMRTLRERDADVVGVDVLPSPFTDAVGSIADAAFVNEHMRGVGAVLHAATLHKPHVATHVNQAFVDTNVTGTLNLLEAATREKVGAFIFTSTTSTFGDALTPPRGAPAAWITEDVVPRPKNIYGVTKTAAEDLCQLFQRNHGLNVLVLRTSRFFPEEDDVAERRSAFEEDNLKVNELLYRRVDIEDVVSSHLIAIEKAPALRWGKFIITATAPFTREDCAQLGRDAPFVIAKYYPDFPKVFARIQWKMLAALDRVYVNERARTLLGWQPKYDFGTALRAVAEGADYRSPLTHAVGATGYHRVR